MVTEIISGGQSGTDEGSLLAAQYVGFKTGGYMAKGFRTEDGNKPEYAERFGMIELASDKYPVRTAANVQKAHLTILLGYDLDSAGSRATKRAATNARKTILEMPLPIETITGRSVAEFLADEHIQTCGAVLIHWLLNREEVRGSEPRTVNFAGNRAPWLTPYVEAFLCEVFARVRDDRVMALFDF